MGRKRQTLRYWVRVYEDFIYSDINRRLMLLRNGPLIVVTYITLCVMASRSGGVLYTVRGFEKRPFDVSSLVELYPKYTATKFRRILDILVEYRLIIPVEGGGYAINGFLELEGEETYAAREQRFRNYGRPCYLPWEAEAERGTPGRLGGYRSKMPAPAGAGPRSVCQMDSRDSCSVMEPERPDERPDATAIEHALSILTRAGVLTAKGGELLYARQYQVQDSRGNGNE